MTKSLIIYEDLLWISTMKIYCGKKMLRFTPRPPLRGGLGGALRALVLLAWYLLSAWVVRTRFLLTPTSGTGILVFSLGSAEERQGVTDNTGLGLTSLPAE